MIIHLDELKDGSHRQSWAGQIVGIDLIYPEISASVQVKADIHRLRDIITVRGFIRAQLTRPCDRCLKPAHLALEAPLHVIIRQRAVALAPEEGDDGEYLLTVSTEDVEVDLTDQIRDRLIVEVPMVIHCHEDCKGLCPRCGADLNEGPCGCPVEIDPRWEALKAITIE